MHACTFCHLHVYGSLENEQKMSLDEFKALSEKSRVHPSHNLRTVSETEDQNHWGDTQRLQQDDKTDEGTRKPRPVRMLSAYRVSVSRFAFLLLHHSFSPTG